MVTGTQGGGEEHDSSLLMFGLIRVTELVLHMSSNNSSLNHKLSVVSLQCRGIESIESPDHDANYGLRTAGFRSGVAGKFPLAFGSGGGLVTPPTGFEEMTTVTELAERSRQCATKHTLIKDLYCLITY